jgi:hypothetical protein
MFVLSYTPAYISRINTRQICGQSQNENNMQKETFEPKKRLVNSRESKIITLLRPLQFVIYTFMAVNRGLPGLGKIILL